MDYLEREAPAGLEDVLQGMWGVRLDPQFRHERVFPTPALHLVINGSGEYRWTSPGGHGGERSAGATAVFCSGLQVSALRNVLPERILNIGARIEPDAARVFGWDPSHLAGQVLDLTAQSPELARLARELPTLGLSAGLDRLAELLAQRRVGEPDPAVRRFVTAVLESPGRAIPDLATEVGLTHPALIARVRDATGLTPKAFADLVRFDRFIDMSGRATDQGWARLAVDAGFYDQSHLIRVFRRFTGLTPAAYLRRVRRDGPQTARFLDE